MLDNKTVPGDTLTIIDYQCNTDGEWSTVIAVEWAGGRKSEFRQP